MNKSKVHSNLEDDFLQIQPKNSKLDFSDYFNVVENSEVDDDNCRASSGSTNNPPSLSDSVREELYVNSPPCNNSTCKTKA